MTMWTPATPARPWATPARPGTTLANSITGPTPAQADGHPNFVVDVPVQGPTDEGMRAASCWWAQNRLPAVPACVDCYGPIPQWTRNTLCPGNRLTNSGIGEGPMETISFGSVGVRGFALDGSSDPEVFDAMNADQVGWVNNALAQLNDYITSSTGTSCPTWSDPTVGPWKPAVGCFQLWYNANFTGPTAALLTVRNVVGQPLRTDGVLDEDTLCALQVIVPPRLPSYRAFPDPDKKFCGPPGSTKVVAKKGLSTGAMVGIGVAGAAVMSGIVYAATRKPTRSGSKSRRR